MTIFCVPELIRICSLAKSESSVPNTLSKIFSVPDQRNQSDQKPSGSSQEVNCKSELREMDMKRMQEYYWVSPKAKVPILLCY
jgi:hypothetical protein